MSNGDFYQHKNALVPCSPRSVSELERQRDPAPRPQPRPQNVELQRISPFGFVARAFPNGGTYGDEYNFVCTVYEHKLGHGTIYAAHGTVTRKGFESFLRACYAHNLHTVTFERLQGRSFSERTYETGAY